MGLGERLRRLDHTVIGAPGIRHRPPTRTLLLALGAGLVASGPPAAVVAASGRSLLVAAMLPLLALIPVVLVLLVGPPE